MAIMLETDNMIIGMLVEAAGYNNGYETRAVCMKVRREEVVSNSLVCACIIMIHVAEYEKSHAILFSCRCVFHGSYLNKSMKVSQCIF